MKKLCLSFICMLLICGCTSITKTTTPQTLLFSPITPEYLGDTADDWKATGYDGFLLSHIMRDWSTDIWATDGDSTTRDENDQTFEQVKSCNEQERYAKK